MVDSRIQRGPACQRLGGVDVSLVFRKKSLNYFCVAVRTCQVQRRPTVSLGDLGVGVIFEK